jgi:hypothetical protein
LLISSFSKAPLFSNQPKILLDSLGYKLTILLTTILLSFSLKSTTTIIFSPLESRFLVITINLELIFSSLKIAIGSARFLGKFHISFVSNG